MEGSVPENTTWRDRIGGKKLSPVNSNAARSDESGSGMQKVESGLGNGEVVPASITHKKVNWFQATLILIAETVSLGILSLPASVAAMGLVVGAFVIAIFGICTLATGFMLYYFRMRYPHVQNFGQAGFVLAGKPGQYIAETLFQLLLVFVMAAHILTFGTMANTVAGDSWKCTVVFKLIGFFVCLACTLPRTFKSNSYLSAVSCLSILTATLIALVDISIIGEGEGTAKIAPPSSVVPAAWMMALSNVLVSFTGHLAYFQVMAEMDRPQDFRKSLIATNISMSSLYLVVAIVIYYYAGAGVGSPALSSAAPLFAKLSYGIATPTIVVAGVIAGLLACKRIQAWFWESVRNEPKAADEISLRSWTSWVSIVIIFWALAFILANVLPYFSPLLALIGAISGTWITLGIPSMTCMYMCHHGFASTEVEYNVSTGEDETGAKSVEMMTRERQNWRWWQVFTFPAHASRKVQCAWAGSIVLFILGIVMVAFGGYGSIQTMVTLSTDNYAPFSCK
ncbi:hypothetical protein CBER1_09584 [Cercospora berteroae]|uniref:Amino acid transporter transmembrane domain-containing protein n=1 Tax=Cercospora berteroae TaxID=357750 RepID=A0A2S6BWL1_9PEZI|nr:hypothetical protein CBER1_09584 [Cercospora berteroae]